MSSDNQIRVSLEVAVPRIILPSVAHETRTSQRNDIAEAQTQVRLLSVANQPHPPGATREQPTSLSEAAHTTKQGLFHLFHMAAALLPEQTYILQILRQPMARLPSGRSREDVTEELAFTLQSAQEPAETTEDTARSSHKTLFPGRQHITINLNEDGIPCGYHIDGAAL